MSQGDDREPQRYILPSAPLRAHVNLSCSALDYPLEQWADVDICTDLTGPVDQAARVAECRKVYLRRNPSAIIGTHLSGAYTRKADKMQYAPRETIPHNWLPAWAYRGQYDAERQSQYVNLSDQPTRWAFARLAALELESRQRVFLNTDAVRVRYGAVMLDNVISDKTTGDWIKWSDTCDFVATLRRTLRAPSGAAPVGITAVGARAPKVVPIPEVLIFANLTLPPGWYGPEEADLLAGSVDGMIFENLIHARFRDGSAPRADGTPFKQVGEPSDYPHPIVVLIAELRDWLRAGKTVIAIPIDHAADWSAGEGSMTTRESEFIAAFALLAREHPSQSLRVTHPFWRPLPRWESERWLTRLGQPLADYVCTVPDGDMRRATVTRVFRGGTITLEIAGGRARVEFTPVTSRPSVSVERASAVALVSDPGAIVAPVERVSDPLPTSAPAGAK